MPTADTPDFLDGLDEPAAGFPSDLPDLPDLPDDVWAGLPDLPDPPEVVDLTVTPMPAPRFRDPAPPAVTPPPVRTVALAPPLVAASSRVVRALPVEVEQRGDRLHVRMLVRAYATRGAGAAVVSLPVPDRVKRVTGNRPMRSEAGRLVWELGDLAAGDVCELRAKFILTTHARVDPLADAEFTFTRDATAELSATASGPNEVPAGEAFPATLTVTNTGEAITTDIRVRLTGPTGPPELVAELAPLAPGESATCELTLTPDWAGPSTWRISADADDVSTTVEFTATAFAAEIAVELVHDKTVLADAETDIGVTVHNRSVTDVRGVSVWLALPDELAIGNEAGKRIDWPATDLKAGETRTLTTRVRGQAPGLAWLRAGAESAGGLTANTGGSLWCEIDPRAGGSSLDAVLTAVQSGVPDDWQRPAAQAVQGERHVLFDIAGTRFAVPISQVREVIRPPAVTPVPGTPGWLVGLTNVRGDVVSVVDLPGFLHLDETPTSTRRGLLIAHTADGELVVGLLVDEVASIRRLPTDGPALPPGLEGDRVAPFLAGVCEHQQRLIPRLDLERLLRSDELHAVTA